MVAPGDLRRHRDLYDVTSMSFGTRLMHFIWYLSLHREQDMCFTCACTCQLQMGKLSVLMSAIVSQITSLTIVYSAVYSGADQRKHQSSASLAFLEGDSPEIGEFPAQRASNGEMFPFDDVIMHLTGLLPLSWCQNQRYYSLFYYPHAVQKRALFSIPPHL